MPGHVLPDGKQVIVGLCRLGEALGYHVATEVPVRKDRHNSPAVDVGWFTEQGHDCPLMSFEVESSATSGIASNASKVYGQHNREFEKPLFFFHIIVKGGRDTTRLDDAQGAFGRHNYRHYRLGGAEKTELVKDILSQHRRLTRRLDLLAVVPVLSPYPETAILWPRR